MVQVQLCGPGPTQLAGVLACRALRGRPRPKALSCEGLGSEGPLCRQLRLATCWIRVSFSKVKCSKYTKHHEVNILMHQLSDAIAVPQVDGV